MKIKTLGTASANLILTLYEKNKVIFTISDVEKITGLKKKSAYRFASELMKRKLIIQLKPGKYFIIPQELGKESLYIGNWFVVAREIANSPKYYISYYSAMDIHNMLTQPLLKVYITTPKQLRKKIHSIVNVTFEFIYSNSEKIWGIEEAWVTNTEKVRVSDIERTIIDCLYKPKYCGGILEISKGIWIQKDNINFKKLINYLEKFDKFVVAKRLGFILQTYNLLDSKLINEFKKFINQKYYLLDPTIPSYPTYKNSWKLIVNISPDELIKATRA
ncbi:MAG: hypothetical protein KKC53_06285 [Actinobacteria bacterium]|nr:hypothetical protein [Actinomycetota bacterium]